MFLNIKSKYKNKYNFRLSSESGAGFTIIEIIIAILVMTIGIIGVFSAFYVIIFLSSDSADRFTAAYLSQEGLEIIRNIRDTNWINYGPDIIAWNQYITDRPTGSNDEFFWEADYIASPVAGTGSSLNPWVDPGTYLNIEADGFYSYRICATGVSNCQTKFKRKITVRILNEHALKVLSEVSWDKRMTFLEPFAAAGSCSPLNCIETEEVLYDWY